MDTRDSKHEISKKSIAMSTRAKSRLQYSIFDTPPIPLAIFQGFQHTLLMIGGTMAVPLLVTSMMCMEKDAKERGEVISTVLFMSGLVTIIQTTFGIRLPILQGATFAFLAPTIAILNLEKWECPLDEGFEFGNDTNTSLTFDPSAFWKPRMLEIQGAIIAASSIQVIIGFTGIVGVLMRFIGPLTIAPTITLIGLALFEAAADHCSANWGIAALTMALITVCSQYLKTIPLPIYYYSCTEKRFVKHNLRVFQLFPILISMAIAWLLCYILTETSVFAPDPPNFIYTTRTDAKQDILRKSDWIRFPYPLQWGMPQFTLAGFLGMLAGVVAGIIESIGDYHACARIAEAPHIPKHALNRGVLIEGVGCLLAGLWGSGSGTTSYSENISAISLTGVGSRLVLQMAGCVLLFLGCFPKFGSLFVTIPDPIIGGVLVISFGIIVAVGISNLQHTDMNSSRNHFVLGFSIMFAFSIPHWIKKHPGAIDSGSGLVDQLLEVLLTTPMFIAGTLGTILDNTIPGTPEERGISTWAKQKSPANTNNNDEEDTSSDCYDIPFISGFLRKHKIFQYLPVSPSFKESLLCTCNKQESPGTDEQTDGEMGTTQDTTKVNIVSSL